MRDQLPLATAIERASHRVGVYLGERLRDFGLSQAEAHVLAQLDRHGATGIGRLLELFGHRRSTLTSVLDRLEARGYVTRETDPADRRTFIVSLTEAGSEAAGAIATVLAEFDQGVLRHCDPAAVAGFESVLIAIDAVTAAG